MTATPWNARTRAYTAGPDASPFWPKGGIEPNARGCGRWWTLGTAGFVGMIAGFIFYWPIGLAVLGLNMLNRRGYAMPFADLMNRAMEKAPFTAKATGNVAFDEWRQIELERIEKERQRLADAEREFAAFSEELRRAKDREEFDRFMAARRADQSAAS